MRLKILKAENFLSFGKVTFDLMNAGLVLVEGENCDDKSAKSNGSGKSAMIDALVWCLFGKTLRGYENDEVVNRRVGDDCLVTVTFEDERRAVFAVMRARRHSKYKNSLRVVAASTGDDMSGPSNAETQLVVEKLLGCSMKTFLSSVVFGQNSAYRFSSLTDKEQKEILDEVLGVERFSEACDVARKLFTTASANVENDDLALGRVNGSLNDVVHEIEDFTKKDLDFENATIEKLKEENERLDTFKKKLKKLSTYAQLALERQADLDKFKDTLSKRERVLDDLNDGFNRASTACGTTMAKKLDTQDLVRKHEKTKTSGDCVTCGQKIDGMQHERVLADHKKTLAKANKAHAEADSAYQQLLREVGDQKAKVSSARQAVADAQKLVNEVAGRDAETKATKRMVGDLEARIAELKKQVNPYADLLSRATKKRDKLFVERDALKKKLDEELVKQKLTEFWVKAFGAKGLRSLLLDSSMPLLNQEAARVSRQVTGGSISIEFSSTSELKSGKTVDKFEVKVDNKHGADSYLGNSSGERAKVDLCVGLALQKLVASRSSASFNVAFFDEVFDHLDSAAHERVVDVLSEIDKDSVFVVSHDEDLKAWFPATLTIQKKNGFSKVIES